MRIGAINRAELRVLTQVHRNALIELEQIAKKPGCNGCRFFNQRTADCGQWNTVVPPSEQAAGCDNWEFDEIPFDGGPPAAVKPKPVYVVPGKSSRTGFDDFDDDIPF